MKFLLMTLSGPGGPDRVRVLARSAHFGTQPDELSREWEQCDVTNEWVEQLVGVRRDGLACWRPSEHQLGYHPRSDELVSVGVPVDQVTLPAALALIEPLPFELCSFGAAFFDEWIAADYRRWGFGRSMIDHGWGCMFRGAGHDRLVSRRWLDFGPWRIIRRPNDTTLIQFHDLAITDPAEAYEQAKVGHERMGNSSSGGYIAWYIDGLLKGAGQGIYTPEDRLLEVVVGPGNEVKQSEMLCNAALRLHHRTAPSTTPVERVAYVFVDEADARAHLHELWLRELECWLVDDKGKRRLDLDYHPVPNPPAWVKRLDAGS